MTKPTINGDARDTPSPTMIVLSTIGDTTWRMFVPVFAGAIIGYFLDKTFASLPIGVLTGTGLGIFVAALLVYYQYRNATKGDS